MKSLSLKLSKRDVELYQLALRVAEDSDCSDKHGTVVVRGGAIIAVAANRFNGNPISHRWLKKTMHSEQRALQRLGRVAKGAVLYTARAHANPRSMPCQMCMHLIKQAGIATIVYHDGEVLVKERL